jgi:hypothetical protein
MHRTNQPNLKLAVHSHGVLPPQTSPSPAAGLFRRCRQAESSGLRKQEDHPKAVFFQPIETAAAYGSNGCPGVLGPEPETTIPGMMSPSEPPKVPSAPFWAAICLLVASDHGLSLTPPETRWSSASLNVWQRLCIVTCFLAIVARERHRASSKPAPHSLLDARVRPFTL